MASVITIIDQGRGPQLSTSRITVLDLVPYFQQGSARAEIRRWLPTLSDEEISVAEEYYLSHRLQLDAEDRQARRYREEQVQAQRARLPQLPDSPRERLARLKQLLPQGWR